ncbi:hypothetical protein Pcinc_042582 [Petrolisthes cinctipes]|uniref:Uncharacterized protein n=1 Tax=Petrolisthes cinctipes TaxID=88211 RepID=A0AAE1BHM5_PETCI|nr:hypothetical protein Pcinc_042582 [Petrolisthes cinctipes]
MRVKELHCQPKGSQATKGAPLPAKGIPANQRSSTASQRDPSQPKELHCHPKGSQATKETKPANRAEICHQKKLLSTKEVLTIN